MNVSIVSVSRRAAAPHFGHVTLTNSGTFSSGERPVPVISMRSGRITGRSVLGHRNDAAESGSGSPGSACPSSAGARCPSPSGGT